MTATYFGQSIQGKLNISPLCYLSMDNVPSNKQAEELGAASRTSVSVPSLNPASTSHLTITFELSAPTALEENVSISPPTGESLRGRRELMLLLTTSPRQWLGN